MANLFGLSQNDNIDASQIYINNKPLDDIYVNENQTITTLGDLTLNNLRILGNVIGMTGNTGATGITGATGVTTGGT